MRRVGYTLDEYLGAIGEIHFVKIFIQIPKECTKYFLFKTPVATRIFAKANVRTNGQIIAEIYHDAVVSSMGTPVQPFCTDLEHACHSQLIVYGDPVITDFGELFWAGFGCSEFPVEVSTVTGYSVVAKRDSNYIWGIKNIGSMSSYVDFNFYWWENARIPS